MTETVLLLLPKKDDIMYMLSSSDPLSNQTRKGVWVMDYLIDFIASVAGNVVGYLIAEWLDRRR